MNGLKILVLILLLRYLNSYIKFAYVKKRESSNDVLVRILTGVI